MDITQERNTSGVDRYLEVLFSELSIRPEFLVHRLQLVESDSMIFPRKTVLPNGGIFLRIPMPRHLPEVLGKSFWTKKYNEQVFRLAEPLLRHVSSPILHLHTLNLIDQACLIRDRLPGTHIVTHLHCIPWKALYNTQPLVFNLLYERYYIKQDFATGRQLFFGLGSEQRAYELSDEIICVTQCAKIFLQRIAQRQKGISVVPNGLGDEASCHRDYSPKEELHCLYVGVFSASKGVLFILDALQRVLDQGYKVSLTACGLCNENTRKKIQAQYPSISLAW